VPFSRWLPAAILAPTPVSALVHSSTLVTAGVYLLFRFCSLFSSLLLNVGIFTTLIAGLAAAMECDTKKIIALSTLRQLGLIVTSLGLGARCLCFAHLNTHAAFKALLFLALGSYIHSMYGTQESRSTVCLHSSAPLILVVLVSACISMCGLVFLSGWVTKEAILESRFNSVVNLLTLLLFYLGIGLTLVYRFRLAYICSVSSCHATLLSSSYSCTLPNKAPLYWLLRLSVIQGYIFGLNCLSSPPLLSYEDKFVVWGVLLSSIVLGHCLSWRVGFACSPNLYLSLTSSLMSSLSVVVTPLQFTEVSALQGGGLAGWSSLLRPIGPGKNLLSPLTIRLLLCFVLL